MKNKKSNKEGLMIWIFALAGTLFSGYLTIGTLVIGACPLKGECPYFLGFPACNYGLIMFGIMLITTSLLLFGKKRKDHKLLTRITFIVAIAGVLFSGYFSVKELFFTTCVGGCSYVLLLPSRVYGLIMYVVILIVSGIMLHKMKN